MNWLRGIEDTDITIQKLTEFERYSFIYMCVFIFFTLYFLMYFEFIESYFYEFVMLKKLCELMTKI
jgi:hypothetical protein